MNSPKWQGPVFIDPEAVSAKQASPSIPVQPQEFDPDQVRVDIPADTDKKTTGKGLSIKRLFWSGVALILGYGLGAELSRLLHWSFQQAPVLGWLFMALMVFVALTFAALLIRVLRSLKQMRRSEELRSEAARLIQARQDTEAVAQLVGRLEKHCENSPCGPELAEAVHLIDNQYNAAEMIEYLSREGFIDSDKTVQTKITSTSAKTGLLIALSPLVSLDLVIIGWSNWRLVGEISQYYGISPSVTGQYRLLKSSMIQLSTIGLSEMAMDAGQSLMGDALASKLSLRAGQGMAAALLTARLGFQAQALCRPLPFTPEQKPSLAQVRDHLITEFKNRL